MWQDGGGSVGWGTPTANLGGTQLGYTCIENHKGDDSAGSTKKFTDIHSQNSHGKYFE